MFREFLHNALIVAIAILGGLLIVGDLVAQDPSAPKPTPITVPPTKVVPAPQPIEKQPGAQPAVINTRVLKPDLELELSPRSAVPTSFRVKNSGLADATEASLLRVSIRLLPLTDEDLRTLMYPWDALTPEVEAEGRFAGICTIPFPDFQAAIGPLDAGESQVVSQSGTRVSGGVRDVGLIGARPATRIPTHSYIRQIEVRLVCVYEVHATVDANAEVAESNERNNEVVHTFQREVTLR